ncbi:hypothetical protein CEP54_000236 [Fusarium duplospermum]|uniref:Uncharacterized protein n=1 Tax=Fusarium duplospermum TaxID=1325734 RepID=A0A428R8K1_9HYPO|nr:hypothetical protein CEP54_000236 [Fusarium duplospermum]
MYQSWHPIDKKHQPECMARVQELRRQNVRARRSSTPPFWGEKDFLQNSPEPRSIGQDLTPHRLWIRDRRRREMSRA